MADNNLFFFSSFFHLFSTPFSRFHAVPRHKQMRMRAKRKKRNSSKEKKAKEKRLVCCFTANEVTRDVRGESRRGREGEEKREIIIN